MNPTAPNHGGERIPFDDPKSPAWLGSRAQWDSALSRWENEGGAIAPRGEVKGCRRHRTETECEQLRVRIIALDNLVMALFASSPGELPDMASAMAEHISPRPGSTRHRLPLQTAAQMTGLLVRSRQFRAHEAGESAFESSQLYLEGLPGA